MTFKQDRNDELMDALRAEVQFRYEPNFAHKSVVSLFLALPALRAFWPMSSVDYTNPQARDLAGGGYHLTNNNVALFGFDNLAPYVEFDGVNQYLSRIDGGVANWADITGTEAYIEPSQRGLTLGGWFNRHADANALMMGKTVGAAFAYLLADLGTGDLRFRLYDAGAAAYSVDLTSGGTDRWEFLVGRFRPSAGRDIFINGGYATNNAPASPAAIRDTAADFSIGGDVATYMDGRASMCFLCAAMLSDAIIGQCFQQSRAMFGV